MKVSIITATYNSEATILDTIRSLESQTYKNIEYIIVDGLSSDSTIELIKSNKALEPKIIQEADSGIYDALNKGIDNATGDIIGFLHSDDLFGYPNAVKDIVDQFQKSDYAAVYADLEYVSKNDLTSIVRYWKSGPFKKTKLKYGWMPPHPTFYMKRSLYQQLGKFDLNFKISADYDSILRYLWVSNIKVGYLDKVVIKMRVGGASNNSLKSILQKSKEDRIALKKSKIFWPIALLFKNLTKIPQFLKKTK
ncbi:MULTISPECIES: glycosyltransferase family 2 protein [unclassified Pseudoalteromonas]|uniref:glycosyltransferase family 2 protein n=1 Tax=unclassified Pseudoalteromonas TaxID=194690 RepID=UPI0011087917|nr:MULTISPECIES: glycosyltransferase family 2 protein [unclassified Pseudoalteromonas]TMN78122.1 glycosyl transferase [Pseudoalteromonas sp. S410]TMN90448.1 glycosyl transferase [Pseudoalteromonas sp. S408]TMN96472.1 glycosyl transferase [Pseudoalteromonas sp. S407]TMO00601.1 glycosyl transferase [Pseudoalteromonas sp. S409]TMO07569.1 glycosyl transferase [Pseudoalteromonas sp. S186]